MSTLNKSKMEVKRLFDTNKELNDLVKAYNIFRKTGIIPCYPLTERDAIRPHGVSDKRFRQIIFEINKRTLTDLYLAYGGHSPSERQAKAKRIKRITDKALTFKKVGFITITLNNVWLERFDNDIANARKSLKRLIDKCGIRRYELLADYGRKNLRLHFHGVVDLENVVLKQVKVFKTKSLYNIEILNEVGFNSVFVNNDTTEQIISKEVRYICKYMSKEMVDKELKHWRIGSKK